MTNFVIQQVYSFTAIFCLCRYSNEIYQTLFTYDKVVWLYLAMYLILINNGTVILAANFFNLIPVKYKIQQSTNTNFTPAFEHSIKTRIRTSIIILCLCYWYSAEINIHSHHIISMGLEPLSIFKNLFYTALYSDFVLFVYHKICHTTTFYKYHQQHHQHKESIYVTGQWLSQFESICILLLIIVIPFTFFKFNIYEMLVWWLIISGHNISEHCGYNLPIDLFNLIPLSVETRYHDLHHSAIRCNYATYFSFWDRIFNTAK
jgi:sterol desaturase/sphingolipid hydroxylase (fatty acid hydroxylase superfamily)